MNIINVNQFGIFPNTREDITLKVQNAIEHCREIGQAVLMFPKGEYHFWPDKAFEKLYYISNHNQSKTRKVAFPLLNTHHLTIDGNGSEFIMHGLTTPFVIDHSTHITLKNFSIDWEVPVLSQGTVVEVGDGYFDTEITDDYSYEVINNKLFINGEGWRNAVTGIILMDPTTKAIVYGSADHLNYGHYERLKVEEVRKGVVRFSGDYAFNLQLGQVPIFQSGGRYCPGIFIDRSKEVTVQNVSLYASMGMGVIAQKSENMTLDKFNVMIKPGSDRLFSASADATHFVYCKGLISLNNCLFENQMDDSCNVHGIYAQVDEVLSEDSVLYHLVHEDQRGVTVFEAGDRVRFINNETITPYAFATVKKVDYINAQYSKVIFDQPLPKELAPNHVIENLEWVPDLKVTNCTTRANRARSFLITTAGQVTLEHNCISAPGAAIKISGDANYWFESGAVSDILIRNNTFLDSNYCYPYWGSAAIDIDPEIVSTGGEMEHYHKNIRIEGNTFRTFHPFLVNGLLVDGIAFTNNNFEKTDTYPVHEDLPHAIRLTHCDDVTIENNNWGKDEILAQINGSEVNITASE